MYPLYWENRDSQLKTGTLKWLCLLLALGFKPALASSVDCDQSMHTRLETAICEAPALRALDKELAMTVEKAMEHGLMQPAEGRELRNRIARRCYREPDTKLYACLLAAEGEALEEVMLRFDKSLLLHEPEPGKKAGATDISTLLNRQLVIAARNLSSNEDPTLTVTTLVAMIEQIRKKETDGVQSNRQAHQVLSRLKQALVSGCRHAVYGKKWQELLANSELSCPGSVRQHSEIYSLSDKF